MWLTSTQAKLMYLEADRNAVEIEAFLQSGLHCQTPVASRAPEFVSFGSPKIRGSAAALTWV